MAWIKAGNGNVFEVADEAHVSKIVRESPLGKDGKPIHTAWDSDPRGAKAKPWQPADTDGDSE